MSMIRIINPDEIKAVHVVILGLAILALAGNCLLTSAGRPVTLPDGAVDWDPDSLLLAVVEILDLQYAQPTPNGIAVKGLVHGVASGIGIVVAAVGLVFLSRTHEGQDESDTVIELNRSATSAEKAAPLAKRQLDPILTAQILMLVFVGWSFASSLWSRAPEFALGGATLLAIQAAWAFALAYGMNRRAASYAAYVMLAVLFVTAALAVLYHRERNPTLRASYPIGNALFLAACLIPGMLIALIVGVRGVLDAASRKAGPAVLRLLLCVLAAAVIGSAFWLTRSRGPALGLGLGVAALAFFPAPRKAKFVLAIACILGLAASAVLFLRQWDAPSPTGRSASMRVRYYSWNYALDLFREAPITGHGQGGYALLADALAAEDVEQDPTVLGNRISHAHNEWLEIGSDLGSFGLVLILGSLFLTLYGGAVALPRISSSVQRWILVALLASLTALIADQCISTGLRIEGLPLVFYTVIGLIWAMARPVPAALVYLLGRHRIARIVTVVVALAAGLAIVEYASRDLGAARAMVEVEESLKTGDVEQAYLLANQAVAGRLSPQRKLTAMRQEASVLLRSARMLQEKHFSRLQAAHEAMGRDPILAQRVVTSREESEAALAAAMEALARLREVTTSEFGVGRLEYGIHQMLAVYAEAEGNEEIVAQHLARAAEALRREMVRQPFDAELAAQYVMTAGETIPAADAFELLARPLRTGSAPSIYLDVLEPFSRTESYAREVPPLVEEALEDSRADNAAVWQRRWAPEELRLAAMIHAFRMELEEAIRLLTAATQLYDTLGNDAPTLAVANCYAQLAESRFLNDPLEPMPAIRTAETVLKYVPLSQEGRALKNGIAERLVAYHLAAGNEDFARGIVLRQRPNVGENLDRVIADHYIGMARQVAGAVLQRAPERLRQWIDRALELDPRSIRGWLFAGGVALSQRNDSEALRCLEQAIQAGATAQSVMEFVNRGLELMPDSEPLRDAKRQIEAQLGGPSGATQMTQPAEPPPPRDASDGARDE